MSLRERLLKKIPPETVLTISGEKFLVKGLSRSRRADVLASHRKNDGKIDGPKLEGVLMSLCVCDPDSGCAIFNEDEWQSWDSLPAAITGPLVAEIMRTSGMDDDDVGREVKNSDTTGN